MYLLVTLQFYVHVEQVHFNLVVFMIYKYLIELQNKSLITSYITLFSNKVCTAGLDNTISPFVTNIDSIFYFTHTNKKERTKELI